MENRQFNKEQHMLYVETIKAEYERMTDTSLVELQQEADSLTEEARQLLEAEWRSRQQDGPEIESTEPTAEIAWRLEMAERFRKEDQQWLKEKWDFAMGQKLENVPDELIRIGLVNRGLPAEESTYLLYTLKSKVLIKQKEAEADRFGAFVRMLCGMAVIVIALLANLGRPAFFIGSFLMVLSIVQAAIASSRKARFDTILANMQTGPPQEPSQPDALLTVPQTE